MMSERHGSGSGPFGLSDGLEPLHHNRKTTFFERLEKTAPCEALDD
jgi:hypothetical protein